MTVAAMLIDDHGTVAWIGSRSAVGQRTPVFEVHTLTSAGRNRLLASASTIDPRSLKLSDEALRWVEGSTQHVQRIG